MTGLEIVGATTLWIFATMVMFYIIVFLSVIRETEGFGSAIAGLWIGGIFAVISCATGLMFLGKALL